MGGQCQHWHFSTLLILTITVHITSIVDFPYENIVGVTFRLVVLLPAKKNILLHGELSKRNHLETNKGEKEY